MRHRARYAVLLILGLVIVLTSYLAWSSERAFGQLIVEDHQIMRSNGRVVDFTVFKPRTNTYGQPMPVVLTIHGISGSGAAMEALNIELARRNLTVVSIDLAGHGVSRERFGFDTFNEAVTDAYEAVRHIQLADPVASDTLYGVLGHSLGAGIALLFQNMPIVPDSTVIIGGGMGEGFGSVLSTINETDPRNLLIAVGVYDELISQEAAYQTLRDATGLSDVTAGLVHGNFTAGTARKLVISSTNHLFEISDSTVLTQSVDWMVRSLQGQLQAEALTLSPAEHVYQYKSLSSTITTVALVLSLFPLYLIAYLHMPVSLRPTREEKSPEPAGGRMEFGFSIGIGVISAILLLTWILIGFIFDFSGFSILPVSFGTGLTLYSIAAAVVIIVAVRRYAGKEILAAHAPHLALDFRRLFPMEDAKSLALLIPALLWLALWTWVTTELIGVGTALTLPVGGAAALRMMSLVLLGFLFWPAFYADKIWLDVAAWTDQG